MSQRENCRVLVLGGYGHFGARIVRALACTPGITVIAAGRNPSQAAAKLPGVDLTTIELCRLDTAALDFEAELARTRAALVIHTAGPFQGQGYEVAQACLRAGMHYIDLADGRDFVVDFPQQLQALAQQSQRSAISGASTLPALSSAVVDALAPQFEQLHSIDMVIAPAQATPLGMATVRAVLSYCGKPFQCWIYGRWQTQLGWTAPQPVRFARIGPRLASPCDVPDHTLLVQRYPGVATVRFRAALELPFLSRCLAAMAWLRGHGLPLPMGALAGVFARAGRWFDRFGTDLGGMRITLRGQRGGLAHCLHWDLTAPMLHGPEIPTFAAVLLARRFARGEGLPSGAHACMGLLTLAEFESEFARWQIDSGVS
ncbi:saccharopine dehydrogenase NADP-binding domain-containing protein [Stenotrophomonas terrae]|uniref:saccharopine dehydrogenase family protein n=1 Tax=Stenotrophomonas terrae TaxID=405446 RepID=UPI003207E0EA